MHSHLAILIVAEAFLFMLTMGLAASKRTALLGEYVGTAFHLLLLAIIANVLASVVGLASGFFWVVCDVIASTGLIWDQRRRPHGPASTWLSIRMAGHLFAAIWVVSVSLQLGTTGIVIGIALAFGFAGYTLAGGRLPEKALAVPGVLMMTWLLLLAWRVHQGVHQ